jgi:uncharacterized protein YndB with AHSA1/START domain
VTASYEVHARSAAPPPRVFEVLADAPRWREWAGPFVRESRWEREGDPPPGGVGAIRRLGAKAMGSREQIVAYDPPRHLAYTWLTRVVRDYRADVRLESDGGGTRIVWSGTFTPTLPGSGPVMERFFRITVGGFARRLAAHAEKEPT